MISATLNTLEENLNFFINLIQQLPGLIVVMDKDSRFIYSNKYTANLFGYDNESKIYGIDAYEMRCPAVESADCFIAQDQLVINSGKTLSILDIHQYAIDGEKLLLTKKSPFMRNGQVEGVICFCTEVSSAILVNICSTLIKSDQQYFSKPGEKERSYMIGDSINENNLTQREMDCVFYLLRGKASKEIAKVLNISPRTVETHLENIKNKLNCYSKSEIIDKALMHGYLSYLPKSIMSINLSSRP